jgi:hypothetical protein
MGAPDLILRDRFEAAMNLAREGRENADGEIKANLMNLFEIIFDQIKELFNLISNVASKMVGLDGRVNECDRLRQADANQSNERYAELLKRVDSLAKRVRELERSNLEYKNHTHNYNFCCIHSGANCSQMTWPTTGPIIKPTNANLLKEDCSLM